jgi:hypothetical protein
MKVNRRISAFSDGADLAADGADGAVFSAVLEMIFIR